MHRGWPAAGSACRACPAWHSPLRSRIMLIGDVHSPSQNHSCAWPSKSGRAVVWVSCSGSAHREGQRQGFKPSPHTWPPSGLGHSPTGHTSGHHNVNEVNALVGAMVSGLRSDRAQGCGSMAGGQDGQVGPHHLGAMPMPHRPPLELPAPSRSGATSSLPPVPTTPFQLSVHSLF